jgi:5-aminolevulinate synthase
MSYLDEVHAVGMYGPRGGGVSERDGDGPHHDSSRGRWARPMACMGGYITGSEALCDFIRSFASGSSSPPRCRPPWPPLPGLDPPPEGKLDVERDMQRRQVARLRARLDEMASRICRTPATSSR